MVDRGVARTESSLIFIQCTVVFQEIVQPFVQDSREQFTEARQNGNGSIISGLFRVASSFVYFIRL